MILRVPGQVYLENLDPMATGVPGESGWPAARWEPRGFGGTAVYDVPLAVARDIVAWVRERCEGLTFGVDPDMARVARRCIAWADGPGAAQLEAAAQEERQPDPVAEGWDDRNGVQL